jgi:pimeloyl-ACP methyl ester carboxylesterase
VGSADVAGRGPAGGAPVWRPEGGLELPGTSTVTVRGRRVRVRLTGPADAPGVPVLLLHGIGRSLEDWTDQHELLAARGHRVLSTDLAGHGWSDEARAPSSLPTLARHVEDTLDALGWTRPAHVVGNSLGGAVAMQLSVEAPERVASLVLVNSAGFGREVTAALRVLAVRPLAPLLLRPSRSAAARTERAVYGDPSHATPERIELGLQLATRPHGARVLLETARALGGLRGVHPGWRTGLLQEVAAAGVPTLVTWGDRDQILPAVHLPAAAAALPHARTHLFPGAGHMPQVERPAEFAALVDDFWATVGQPSGAAR